MSRDEVLNKLRSIGVDYSRRGKDVVDAFVAEMADETLAAGDTAARFLTFAEQWKLDHP